VKETAEAVGKLLTAKGWQPYGTAIGSQYFKDNAVKLSVMTSSAPGQGGKTVIQLSSEMLSVDLPAPPGLLDAQYAETTKALSLDVAMTPVALADYYRDTLGKAGWKATTEKPFQSDFHEMMIFRNAAKDFLFLTMTKVEGKLRAELRHQTAAEFDADLKAAQAEEAKRKAESKRYAMAAAEAEARKRVTVEIAAPAGAKNVQRDKDSLKFKLAAGTARAAVQALRADLVAKGWTADKSASLDQPGGSVILKNKDANLTVVYIDTGFDDAQVDITAFGATLAQPRAK
jgi:hypothetical protein